MKSFTIFHPLAMSFYSRALYQDVARNWRGVGALYLLLLLTIAWLPMVYRLHTGVNSYLTNEAPQIIAQMPQVEIKEGLLSVDRTVPYIIYDNNDQPLVIFDTSDKPITLSETKAYMVVTKDAIWLRKSDGGSAVYKLDKTTNMNFGKQEVESFAAKLGKWSAVGLLPILILISYVFRFVQALFHSLFGLLFSRMLRANLNYQQILRLSVVALTPVVLMTTLLDFFLIKFPLQALVLFLLGLVYIFYAILSTSDWAIKNEF